MESLRVVLQDNASNYTKRNLNAHSAKQCLRYSGHRTSTQYAIYESTSRNSSLVSRVCPAFSSALLAEPLLARRFLCICLQVLEVMASNTVHCESNVFEFVRIASMPQVTWFKYKHMTTKWIIIGRHDLGYPTRSGTSHHDEGVPNDADKHAILP
eukprot:6455443-Amphidinium_carterae.1